MDMDCAQNQQTGASTARTNGPHRIAYFGALLACSLILGGCVTPVPIAEQSINPSYMAGHPVLVSVVDEREEVREGKPANYIGRMHLAFGIPADMSVYPIVTEEKSNKDQTLAEALEERIVNGFRARGWTAVGAGLASSPSADQLATIIKNGGAKRFLLLTLDRWFVSVNTNWVTAFNFDWGVRIQVVDDSGTSLVDFRESGRDVVDAEYNQSYGNHIRIAYKNRLTKLLEDARVRDALTDASRGASD